MAGQIYKWFIVNVGCLGDLTPSLSIEKLLWADICQFDVKLYNIGKKHSFPVSFFILN